MKSPQCRHELKFSSLTLYCMLRKRHKGVHQYDPPRLQRMYELLFEERLKLYRELTAIDNIALSVVDSIRSENNDY